MLDFSESDGACVITGGTSDYFSMLAHHDALENEVLGNIGLTADQITVAAASKERHDFMRKELEDNSQ